MYLYLILAFLLGIIFVQWMVPLVDGLINLFLTQLEVWKHKMNIKITHSQVEMQRIKDESEKSPSSLIGFAISTEEEDEEIND